MQMQRDGFRPLAIAGALAILLVATLVLMILPVMRLAFRTEIDYNEGWNAYYSQKVMQGRPLYSADSEWTSVNYPPLSFYVTAVLGRLLGDVLLAGRLLSLLSLLAISYGTGYVVWTYSRRLFAAVFAALLCVGSFGAFATHYVGMNDPQLLAHCWTLAAFLLYVVDKKQEEKPTRVLVIAVLCAVGLFTKHSIVAMPFAIALDMLIESRRKFAWWSVFFALAVCALVLFTVVAEGSGFFAQLASPRRFFVEKLLIDSARFGLKIIVSVAVLLPWAFRERRARPVRVASLTFVLGLLAGVYTSGGYGTDVNMFFDCIIALSVLSGLFVARHAVASPSRTYSGRFVAGLMPIALAFGVISMSLLKVTRWGTEGELRYGIWRPGLYRLLEEAQAAHYDDVSRMQLLDGAAICDNLLLGFDSKKQFVFDPFFVGEAIVKGRISEDRLLRQIESGYFRVIQLESPVSEGSAHRTEYGPIRKIGRKDRFTENTKAAIAARCRVAWESMNGVFYVPEVQ